MTSAATTSGPVLHWDDARSWRGEEGHIAGTWHSLTGRASQGVGVKRIQIDPGMWSTPLHLVEGQEEEIFYVLGGSGLSVQWEGEQALDELPAYEVRTGGGRVHLALENAHTLQAGADGLDVLAFGQRSYAGGVTGFPGQASPGSARRGRRSATRTSIRGSERPAQARLRSTRSRHGPRASSTSRTSKLSSATARPSGGASGTSGAQAVRSGPACASRRSCRES